MTFIIAPIEILRADLTPTEKNVLLALYSFRGKNTDTVWPSIAALCERLGWDDGAWAIGRISKTTTSLQNKGWLKKRKHGFGGSNKYELIVPDVDGKEKPKLDDSANFEKQSNFADSTNIDNPLEVQSGSDRENPPILEENANLAESANIEEKSNIVDSGNIGRIDKHCGIGQVNIGRFDQVNIGQIDQVEDTNEHTNEHTNKNITGENSASPPKSNRKPKSAKPGAKPSAAQPDFSKWPELPSSQVWADYKKLRKAKQAPLSQTVLDSMARELHSLARQGITVDRALAVCMDRGWRGLKAEWVINHLFPAQFGQRVAPAPIGASTRDTPIEEHLNNCDWAAGLVIEGEKSDEEDTQQ